MILQCYQCSKVNIHGVFKSTARNHNQASGGVAGCMRVPALTAGATKVRRYLLYNDFKCTVEASR